MPRWPGSPARAIGCLVGAVFPFSTLASSLPVYDQDLNGFVASTGERASIMGYPAGLEIWAYPLQLVSDYHIRFRVAGSVEPIDAAPLLRRVERTATEVVRTYVGANFTVRERLFVPRTSAGVFLRYEIEGRPDVRIEATLSPSLNLMWPAALGGQTVTWDNRRDGYVEREPLHKFTATIASRQVVDHDQTTNVLRSGDTRLTMLLQPAGTTVRVATLIMALDSSATIDGAAALLADEPRLRADAEAHAADVLAQAMSIETPDPVVNRALASATLALDQAWACNVDLGCGELAGFGPSRPGRRPQYAWFFAGDGLVAMDAMLDAGQFERARAELAFVTRFEDPKTGMIWHEISQSAGLINWKQAYPYMYVHVDISFQYLAALARYEMVTGDQMFARQNWQAIEKAWRYCNSVIDRDSGLPHIPEGKQGQNEQEQLRDDIRLSSLWIDAAEGFAQLARTSGHASQADAAQHAALTARQALAQTGWDEQNHFWLSGHSLSGDVVPSQRSDAIGLLDQGIFSPDKIDQALDRLSSPDFLTDWGIRSMAASDPAYDPNLYSAGSVWGLGSAEAAQTFWRNHRPLVGWRIWRALVDWNSVESGGHLPEVLAGDLYHLEQEAVPEQTWSSAGLLSSAVHGLIGLTVDAAKSHLTVSPHLPAGMDSLHIRQLRVGGQRVDLTVRRGPDGIDIAITNPGPSVHVLFNPMVPLGSVVDGGTVAGRPVTTTAERYLNDEHARLEFSAGTGETLAHIQYHAGLVFDPVREPLRLGESSHAPIFSLTRLSGTTLTIEGWTTDEHPAALDITTTGSIAPHAGGLLTASFPGRYRWTSNGALPTTASTGGYRPFSATFDITSAEPSVGRSR